MLGLLTQQFAEMDAIQEEMKDLYLRDSRPFVVLYSTGKDSSLVLKLTWQMLSALPTHLRRKPIHIITSDTKVEVPSFTAFVKESLQMIEESAKEQNLPILVHFAEPKLTDSYFYQVIGKGNPPPTQTSRMFRWCTSKLKIKSVDRVVMEILDEIPPTYATKESERYDALMLLGVREDESKSRKQTIQKYALHDKFARHAEHDRILCYHPIKHVTTDMLWPYLLQENLPWGMDSTRLYSIYKDASGECPMTQAQGKQHTSCGGGRMGCWTCGMVGKQDKMLINLIENGEEELIPLLRFKQTLLDMQYDVRFREPYKRNEIKSILKPLLDLSLVWTEEERSDYARFKRAEPRAFAPGPITLEGRRILLGMLLDAQAESGQELISQAELDAILDAWRDDGYEPVEEDRLPHTYNYPGPLLFTPDARLNAKTTQNPNPVFAVVEEFDLSLDDLVTFLKDRAIKTEHHLHYFVQNVDYARDFGMTKDDPVVHQVQFIVCEKEVASEEDAKTYVAKWLGEGEQCDKMDWNALANRIHDAAQQEATRPNPDAEKLARYNKTLMQLGYPKVRIKQIG